jgi:endonuclease/exonuclease/phosphatase family metal-dependent hydrolase
MIISSSRRKFIKGVGLTGIGALVSNQLLGHASSALADGRVTYKILCCNIRVALPEDEAQGVGWKQRKDICIKVMKSKKPDIICFQEVLEVQNYDLKAAFPNFFSFGFDGPEMDGHRDAYHGIAKNPIFFSTKKYELIGSGTFWLSETPLVAGSLSWDSARARQANWVRLKDKKTDKTFRVVNTHLDHKGQKAREEQIGIILKESDQYAADYPQILTGDFNSGSDNPVYSEVKKHAWTDSYTAVNGEAAPVFTFHDFKGEAYNKSGKGKKIDFIFLKGPFKTVKSSIIKDNVNGLYPSDHYFVEAEIMI